MGVGKKAKEEDIVWPAMAESTGLKQDIDSDTKSFLTFLDNKLLISTQRKSPPRTGSLPPHKDNNDVLPPKAIRKPKRKTLQPPPTNRETGAVTGSSKPRR